MSAARYQITAPTTPGASPTVVRQRLTRAEARKAAREFSRGRPDLKGQDVRIETLDGALVQYAGPCR